MKSIKAILISTLFLTLILISATAISAQSNKDGAANAQTTQSANDDLADCSQMLDQSEMELKATKQVLEGYKRLAVVNDQIIQQKDLIIAEQKKLIDQYEKRKGTTLSFLFGLIKFTKN